MERIILSGFDAAWSGGRFGALEKSLQFLGTIEGEPRPGARPRTLGT